MYRNLLAGAVLCAGLFATADAVAEVEIGGVAGAHVFSGNNELGVLDVPDAPSQRNSILLGLRVGAFVGHVLGIEGELGIVPTVAREFGYGIINVTYRAHLVAQFRAHDVSARLIPFVLAGAGAFSIVASNNGQPGIRGVPSRDIEPDTDAVFYAGAGVKYRGGKAWGIRGDARVMGPPSADNSVPPERDSKKLTLDFEVLVSGYVVLGRSVARVPAPPPPPDDDADKDGLRGDADRCPDAAEDRDGVQDDDGCPDPDNDGDQVLDAADQCPAEPEDVDGFKDDDGCPDLDNDGDKILDVDDRCPLVPESVNTYEDEDGCADTIPRPTLDDILRRFTSRILFDYNKAELGPDNLRVIGELATLLQATPEIELLSIEGHSSRDGEDRYNLKLSAKRAQVAADALIAAGVSASRLQVAYFGAKKPVDPGRKAEQRALNRRVEFKVVRFTPSAAPTTPMAPVAPAPPPER